MAELILFTPNRALDLNGDASPGARAFFYAYGTTTDATVYADIDLTIEHPSPLVADGNGVFPPVYASVPVAVTVVDADDVPLDGYPLELAASIPAAESSASSITFDPTAEIPVSNVQDAIERVQTNIIAPLADFGLGVTGTATFLANLDATDTGSGAYRFTPSTTGTFPTGFTPGSGVVVLWRQAATLAWQWLYTADVVYIRRLNTSWEAWNEVVNPTGVASRGTIAYRGASTWLRLPPGSADQVLSMGANDPAWVGGNIGVGQTWQTPARSQTTAYQNATGRPIQIIVKLNALGWLLQASTNGTTWVTIGEGDGSAYVSQSAIIPPGYYYRATGGPVSSWAELR